MVSVADIAIANPLGTYMGQPASEIEGLEQGVEATLFISKTAPAPSSLFNKYIYRIGKNGLCSIRGNGVMKVESKVGKNVVFKSIPILSSLENKYGQPTSSDEYLGWYDDKSPFSFEDELSRNNLSFWYTWESDLTRSLPFNLKSISFSTSPKVQGLAHINISYEYKNSDSCKTSETKTAIDNL